MTITNSATRRARLAAATAVLTAAALGANAQLASLFDPGNAGKTGPTTITSSMMDIDIGKNIIVLSGNVEIDEKGTNITSDKMTVHLAKGKPGNPNAIDLEKIVAEGNVVIIKRATSDEEKKQGERKVTAGVANYDAKTGVIVLTIHPVLHQGASSIDGERITIWRDSDRMKVEQLTPGGERSKIQIVPENAEQTP